MNEIYNTTVGENVVLRVSFPKFDSVGRPLGNIVTEERVITPLECSSTEDLQKIIDEFRRIVGNYPVTNDMSRNFGVK